jgi:hypothetical protein
MAPCDVRDFPWKLLELLAFVAERLVSGSRNAVFDLDAFSIWAILVVVVNLSMSRWVF